jgi:glycosyltransferase involved in cell wall biosynthesis
MEGNKIMSNEKKGKLLMISNDPKILEEGSAVRARQAEYAREWEEVHIIVFAMGGGEKESVIAPNCWAYSTQSAYKAIRPFDAIRLGKFIVPYVKITQITCQDPFFTAMVGTMLKKNFNVPLEIQVHTDIGSPYFARSLASKVRKSMALSYLKHADTVRVVSERIKTYLVHTLRLSEEIITVKPIHIEVDEIRSAPVLPEADLRAKYTQFDRIVLMASRLEAEKNIALALAAFKIVLRVQPKAGLVIVGSGTEQVALMRRARALDIEASVIFENWIDRPTLFSYYKTTDVFLNTSFFEGFGMTLVEADAATRTEGGNKVVTTDVGVAKEVDAEIVGFDAQSVAAAILKKIS